MEYPEIFYIILGLAAIEILLILSKLFRFICVRAAAHKGKRR